MKATNDIVLEDSPAIKLLQMVWDHSQKSTGHSWLKLNHAMSRTLDLAVESGMEFNEGDFNSLYKRFNAGYWIGDTGGESFYRLAVLYRNNSAWKTYEAATGRKPFIIEGASISSRDTYRGDGPMGEGLARIVIGAEFKWKGETAKVTSFNDAKLSFTACSYTRTPYTTCRAQGCGVITGGGHETLKHRYTITHADILEASKAKRKKTQIERVRFEGGPVDGLRTDCPLCGKPATWLFVDPTKKIRFGSCDFELHQAEAKKDATRAAKRMVGKGL